MFLWCKDWYFHMIWFCMCFWAVLTNQWLTTNNIPRRRGDATLCFLGFLVDRFQQKIMISLGSIKKLHYFCCGKRLRYICLKINAYIWCCRRQVFMVASSICWLFWGPKNDEIGRARLGSEGGPRTTLPFQPPGGGGVYSNIVLVGFEMHIASAIKPPGKNSSIIKMLSN